MVGILLLLRTLLTGFFCFVDNMFTVESTG